MTMHIDLGVIVGGTGIAIGRVFYLERLEDRWDADRRRSGGAP